MASSKLPIGRYSLRHTFYESLISLRSLGRRTALALTGIAIGCASVVALLNIGFNTANESIRAFQGLGTNTILVSMNAKPGSTKSLPLEFDGTSIRAKLPAIQYVAPLTSYSTKIGNAGRWEDSPIIASTPELANVLGLRISHGRGLSRFDEASAFTVVGSNIAEKLTVRVGDALQIDGYIFQVIGIADPLMSNPMLPITADDSIFIPLKAIRRLTSTPELNHVVLAARDSAELDALVEPLNSYLVAHFPSHNVVIQIPRRLLDGLKRQTNTFTYLLAGLGAVSLLVGGVGIMNIMLTNVAERRKEIGIRAALGARRRDIRDLFLLEAAALSLAGACIGAVIGVGLSYLFVKISGWVFSLSTPSLPLGIFSSVCIGIIFGIYPALTAARLPPVQALRDD